VMLQPDLMFQDFFRHSITPTIEKISRYVWPPGRAPALGFARKYHNTVIKLMVS